MAYFDETNEQHIFSKVFNNYVLNFLYVIFYEKFFLTAQNLKLFGKNNNIL